MQKRKIARMDRSLAAGRWAGQRCCIISWGSRAAGMIDWLPITGFIRGILRGVRYAKSLRVLFLHRRSPSWTTLVLYSRAVFIFNEPTICHSHNCRKT
jgi:hypothetical protein